MFVVRLFVVGCFVWDRIIPTRPTALFSHRFARIGHLPATNFLFRDPLMPYHTGRAGYRVGLATVYYTK
jgi:hypothetical protein